MSEAEKQLEALKDAGVDPDKGTPILIYLIENEWDQVMTEADYNAQPEVENMPRLGFPEPFEGTIDMIAKLLACPKNHVFVSYDDEEDYLSKVRKFYNYTPELVISHFRNLKIEGDEGFRLYVFNGIALVLHRTKDHSFVYATYDTISMAQMTWDAMIGEEEQIDTDEFENGFVGDPE